MEGEGKEEPNRSDAVEDLSDRRDIQGAVSVLESRISRLEALSSGPSRSNDTGKASALYDLAYLHSSKGSSPEADALLIKNGAARSNSSPSSPPSTTLRDLVPVDNKLPEEEETRVSFPSGQDDDWEAIADRALAEVGVSESLRENPVEFKTPKRRGRGSFLYTENSLYCDQADARTACDDPDLSREEHTSESADIKNLRFDTGHVLVLYDFPSSTRTSDLEKLFVESSDGTVAIRWINDTCALAVFRTPSAALGAKTSVHHPYRVRGLDVGDNLLSQITDKDLEPPLTRPKTSARTAQRLIAHGMGLKPFSTFGSSGLKEQEDARKNRIKTRQNLREEAWGSDDS